MEPREQEQIRRNMRAFEAALEAGMTGKLGPELPESALLALDGSDQDEIGLDLMIHCVRTFGLRVFLLPAVPSQSEAADPDREALDAALRRFEEAGLEASGLLDASPEAYHRFSRALSSCEADWFVLPCPFGHDLGELRSRTLGTSVEVPLVRGDRPILVVRGPVVSPEQALFHPHVILRENLPESSAEALRLGLGLLASAAETPDLRVTFLLPEESEPGPIHERDWSPPDPDLRAALGPTGASLFHRLRETRPDLAWTAAVRRPSTLHPERSRVGGRLHLLPAPRMEDGVEALLQHFLLHTLDPVLVVPAPQRGS